jgi:hypothetical protein
VKEFSRPVLAISLCCLPLFIGACNQQNTSTKHSHSHPSSPSKPIGSVDLTLKARSDSDAAKARDALLARAAIIFQDKTSPVAKRPGLFNIKVQSSGSTVSIRLSAEATADLTQIKKVLLTPGVLGFHQQALSAEQSVLEVAHADFNNGKSVRLSSKPIITNDSVNSVEVVKSGIGNSGQADQIKIILTDVGKQALAQATAAQGLEGNDQTNNKLLAILLDGKPLFIADILAPLTEGAVIISMGSQNRDIQALVSILQFKSLPDLELASEQLSPN